MDFSQLDVDEKRLVARLEDLVRLAGDSGRRKFSAFLSERQVLVAEELLRQQRIRGCMLFGGHDSAVRRVMGAFPGYQEPTVAFFPVETITVHLPKGAQITHRDVLGSLMSLQIKRESIGDILLEDRLCHIFALEPVAQFIVDELKKVGGTGVRCELGRVGEIVPAEHFQEIRGTIHSRRLDALVSLLTGLAREKSANLIRSDLVRQNDRQTQNISQEISSGDVITVRGYGKYKVDQIGNPTKKGRLPLICRKYI